MRQRNPRLVVVGGVMIALAIVFFFVMMSFSSQSTDPQALLEIVSQTSGVVIGVGVFVAIIGFIGTKVKS